MAEELDRNIVTARREQQSARDDAEETIKSIVSITSRYIIEWAKYLMDRALRDRPDVIQNMPADNLAALKASFNNALAELPELTGARIQELPWPHRAEIPDDLRSNMMASFDLGKRATESLHEAARNLIGRIGTLLIDSGLADTKPYSEWKLLSRGSVGYAYGLPGIGVPGGEEFRKIPDLYQPRLEAYVGASRSAYEAERARQQALARNRWDQV